MDRSARFGYPTVVQVPVLRSSPLVGELCTVLLLVERDVTVEGEHLLVHVFAGQLLRSTLGDDDGVIGVRTLVGHVAYAEVLAQCETTVTREVGVGELLPLGDLVPDLHFDIVVEVGLGGQGVVVVVMHLD